ncbi:MAG TPA: right-handed parallel beta-helix repeat-containing protein [Melioribacteraceae bacterium]|nr:right-handed parallel beta-helix repeat-containing protein [Melioribacteraceae bacterium]
MKRIILFTLLILSNLFAQNIKEISKIGPATEQIDFSKYKEIYYVDCVKGSDKDGTGSIDKPLASVIYALEKVVGASAENRFAILVASGSYSGFTIVMKPFVDLYGGFQSGSWNREIKANKTLLDGQKMRRVVMGADNSCIDGFTIRNGLSKSHGGGILCDDTSPVISNCIIENNYVMEPDNFNYSRIHQNGNHGGGIACLYNSVPVIRNNIFYSNETSIGNGGGIAFYGWLRNDAAPPTKILSNRMEGGWQPLVANNIFINNTSGVNDWGRTRSSNGGAISCAYESRPVIENNLIICNQARGRSDAGGIYTENFSYPLIKGNWIVGNISDDDGGGIYTNHTGHALITHNFIAGNWTVGKGAGGVRLSKESRATVKDNIIVHNQTGGGVQSVDSYMELVNNIIMHNKGNVSLRYSNVFSYFVPSLIENNIILDNENKISIELKEGEKINFRRNNLNEKVDGSNNSYNPVEFENNEIKIEIDNYQYNPESYQTVVTIRTDTGRKDLTGRVFNSGDFWSVISKIEGNKIFMNGNVELRNPLKTGIILSDYKIRSAKK